jgi:hypothetical protein
MSRETLVHAFHDGKLYEFERADEHTRSAFGGAMPRKITGQAFGPKPLHQIACLSGLDIPALSTAHIHQLPLVFGMHYDGCGLSYRVKSRNEIEILRIKPSVSLDNWPYENFPPLIPYVPLQLKDSPREISFEEFAARFTTDIPDESVELIVCVPEPATIGLSFWGDWHNVTTIFECDLKRQEVRSMAMAD